jgi:prevent-host-death family protein
MEISKDLITVTEFRKDSKTWLARLAETGSPLVLTQNGKAAAVLLTPELFDEFNKHLASTYDAARRAAAKKGHH